MADRHDSEAALAQCSCDSFLGGRFRAFQPAKGPRAAIDALFLAAAVPALQGAGDAVFEAGLGTGVAALALATRVADVRITGVELQPALCAIARENVRLNGFEERITVVEGDVMAPAQLRERGLKQDSFAHVMANPPYHSQAASRASDNSAVATAYVAGADVLEKWARCLASMAAPRATLTLIHRAQETGRVLDALSRRFGQLTLYPLFPRAGAPASRILVQGIKGSRAPLRLLPGMVLHEPDGRYTAQAERILRDAEALRLLPDD